MTETAPNLVADVLHACAAVAPQPWHPAEFVRRRSEPLDELQYCLESLCRVGVLRPVRVGEEVDALVLTPRGADLARDPQALARFCEAEGLRFGVADTPQRTAVRQTLLSPARPRINRVLFWLNIAVFALGYLLAVRQNVGRDFLLPIRQGGVVQDPVVLDILHRTGMLTRLDFLAGEWWRLLTCGFVHFTILHLVMNLYALRILGTDCEWLWGRWRYLVLYLLALLGGSCAGLVQAGSLVGASGALCGLMASEAVWMIVNRAYLPRRLVRGQLRGLLINALLITGLSLLPGVSWAGHLGGALVGAAGSVLLHWQRFGGMLLRRLAMLGLIAVPVGCVLMLNHVAHHVRYWKPLSPAEEKELVKQFDQNLFDILKDLRTFAVQKLIPLTEQGANRRDESEVKAALEKLDKLLRQCRDGLEEASAPGPLRVAPYEELRQAMVGLLLLRIAYLERIRASLANRADWAPHENEREEIAEARKRWEAARQKAGL